MEQFPEFLDYLISCLCAVQAGGCESCPCIYSKAAVLVLCSGLLFKAAVKPGPALLPGSCRGQTGEGELGYQL